MKIFSKVVVAVVVMLFSFSAFAGSLDGKYEFSWRSKGDLRDLDGWTGSMVIENNTISRFFKSSDGKTEKFYIGTYKEEAPNTYAITFTKVYNPKYVGATHKNLIYLKGKKFTMQSLDGGKTFQEVWVKK